jgi:helicase SWR1
VKQRRAAIFAEQQRLRGKQHLNQILEHSTQLLEARRAARNSASVEPSTPRDTESLLLSSSETNTDESMEEESSSDEDSEMEDTVSESSGDEEENNVGGNDANLTVDELRQKYADVINKEVNGSFVEEGDDSDKDSGLEMVVDDDDDAVRPAPNGDYSVDVDHGKESNGVEYPTVLEDLPADDNSVFDEDEDESPLDSEEDEEGSDLENETDEEIPSLGKLLGGWYSDEPAEAP